MTTPTTKTSSPSDAAETPWYELINDAPEPPEDAMQQADIILYIMSILMARAAESRNEELQAELERLRRERN